MSKSKSGCPVVSVNSANSKCKEINTSPNRLETVCFSDSFSAEVAGKSKEDIIKFMSENKFAIIRKGDKAIITGLAKADDLYTMTFDFSKHD